MDTITLTLELTYMKAAALMAFLNDMPTESITAFLAPEKLKEDKGPEGQVEDVRTSNIEPEVLPHPSHPDAEVEVVPTAGKKTKMPGLGRTQAQVDSYVKKEATRIEEKDEEAEIRAQRKEERDAKKAERDKIENDKKEAITKENKIVEDIKNTEALNNEEVSTILPTKPWEL